MRILWFGVSRQLRLTFARIKAIGKTDEESLASIRLTFNHTLNQNQADYCIDCIKKNVAALRKIKND